MTFSMECVILQAQGGDNMHDHTHTHVDEFGNVTSTAIITVPKGCCFSVSVRYVDATVNDPTVTPTPTIEVQNSNLVINRIA